jgi:hypothetical protein
MPIQAKDDDDGVHHHARKIANRTDNPSSAFEGPADSKSGAARGQPRERKIECGTFGGALQQ